MNCPKESRCARTHEWIKMEGDTAVIGLSDYAQNELGDLVLVNLLEVGDQVDAGKASGDVGSVKAVSDLDSPVTDTVTKVNEEPLDAPELVNSDSYGTWLIKVESVGAESDLLDTDAYETLINEES